MRTFTTLADVPRALAGAPGATRSRIQIAELGTFDDPRYGRFSITAGDVANWTRLLADVFGGEVPVDYDHNTDKAGPTGSKAAGWIKSIIQDGTKVFADVEFTPDGADSIRRRDYRYFSPTFVGDYKDKLQKSLGPALLRGALTNNPFLRDMPAINLSRDPVAHTSPPSPTSRTTPVTLDDLYHDAARRDLAAVLQAVQTACGCTMLEAMDRLEAANRTLAARLERESGGTVTLSDARDSVSISDVVKEVLARHTGSPTAPQASNNYSMLRYAARLLRNG